MCIRDRLALGGGKSRPHRVALALAGLAQQLDVALGVERRDALDLLIGPVAAAALDKNNLERIAKARNARDDVLDVAALVAAGHDHRG